MFLPADRMASCAIIIRSKSPKLRTFVRMIPDEDLQMTAALVREPFELPAGPPPANEAELLALLADRIEEMLATRPEYLMSLLYRLDVLEKYIVPALHPTAPEPPHIGLARLVLERQRQRAETKRSIPIQPLEDWEDWM